jgi:hypothetical protein
MESACMGVVGWDQRIPWMAVWWATALTWVRAQTLGWGWSLLGCTGSSSLEMLMLHRGQGARVLR